MSKSVDLQLPPALLDAVREERVVLFLGAGASRGALHPEGIEIPDSKSLRDKISEKFLGGQLKDRSLSEVAELAANETDLVTVQKYIRDLFLGFQPADFHKLIPTFRWHAIVTTNYDLVLDRAYASAEKPVQQLVPFLEKR
ncbi:hypothetical protein MYX82_12490 [Acidobacteria bacterium AH-259-D05]|nr:hypothetical protein [Acidobacteria bacterium AH-259-D05]